MKHFDPARLGVLVVNERPDGTYAVLDGQHRLCALRKLNAESVNCIVLTGLTVQQEADYFRRQNENKQSLRVADLFNASLWAEDERSVKIKQVMEKYGFRVGRSGKGMAVRAIAALERIVDMYGIDNLERVLLCIKSTWPGDTVVLQRELLAALSEFWHRFGDTVPVEQFASRMRTKLPLEILVEAKTRTSGKIGANTAFNKTIRFASCGVIVDHYNKHLTRSSKNRLTMLWDGEEDKENV